MQKNTEATNLKALKISALYQHTPENLNDFVLLQEIFHVEFPPILYYILKIIKYMAERPSFLTTVTVLLVCRSEHCVRPLVEFLNIQLSDTPPNSLTVKSGKKYMIGKGSVEMQKKVDVKVIARFVTLTRSITFNINEEEQRGRSIGTHLEKLNQYNIFITVWKTQSRRPIKWNQLIII